MVIMTQVHECKSACTILYLGDCKNRPSPLQTLQNIAFCTQCTGILPRTVATLKGTRKIAEQDPGAQRNFENASTFFHICDTLIPPRIPASRPMPATGEEPN